MKPKPIVGQTLFSLNVGSAARNREQVLTPTIVTKVGRKFFRCCPPDQPHGTDYHLDTWEEKTEYTTTSVLFSSPKEFGETKRRIEIADELREIFCFHGFARSLPLQSLEQILQIVNNNTETK